MKKISWVTADYFLDCDIDLIPKLNEKYQIVWNIILPVTNNRFSQVQINKNNSLKSTVKIFWSEKFRRRDARNIAFYWKLLKQIKKQQPDLVYINMQGFPYLAFIVALLLKRRNTIFAVHQAKVHEGMQFQTITKLYFHFLYSWFNNFHLFSKSQADIFKSKYPDKSVTVIPLGLKDFGKSLLKKSDKEIVFFNFGTIIKNKNIGLLIQAACNVFEKGYNNFKVKIVGACSNWGQYQKLVIYPELFDLNIQAIDNNEISDLFSSSHYLILPYSAVSQSGPLKIAFNYNVPVIASDLEEFKNEIINGETGLLFKNNDVSSLENAIIKTIANHKETYKQLRLNQLADVKRRYSKEVILQSYDNMFRSTIK
nr:glycosyltransferase family 4 protein [uncultured Draconibacterium sp.]